MQNPYFLLQNQKRPDNIKVTKNEMRFGPLSIQRCNTIPDMEFGRVGDHILVDTTDKPSGGYYSQDEYNQEPTGVGMWLKVPFNYADAPSGTVVIGYPGGTTQAGDQISINGTTVTFTSPYTVAQAVFDINAATINSITASSVGEALQIVQTANAAITVANVTGDPAGTLGLYSQAQLADLDTNGVWVPVKSEVTVTPTEYTIPNIIHVAKNGNDSSGEGSPLKPYLTVNKALSDVIGSGTNNRFSIIVYPGVYTESNPLTVPSYTSISTIGGASSAKIVASDPNSDLIVLDGDDSSLLGIELDGATGPGAALVRKNDNSLSSVHGVQFEDGTYGIRCSLGTVTVNDIQVEGTLEDLFISDGTGVIHINGCQIDTTAVITTVLHTASVGSRISATDIHGNNVNITHGGFAEHGTLRMNASALVGPTIALRAANTSNVFISGTILDGSTTDFQIDTDTVALFVSAVQVRRDKIIVPDGYSGVIGTTLDAFPGDEGTVIWGELAVGQPDQGYESVFGEGDSYTRGMTVLTTDNTATSVSAGGNFTDVSAEAATASGSTFSFQGTTANHTILIGVDLTDGVDPIKHWGLKVTQTTAAVELTKRSFVFELWDGITWNEIDVMSTESDRGYRYANEVFIRANSVEQIRYGIDTQFPWIPATINGVNAYWSRIRITDNLTTAPVFEQFKMHSSRTEIGTGGFIEHYGLSRYRKTITAVATLSGGGGASSGSINVGSGGGPNGWTHGIDSALFNAPGDTIYSQFIIPKGIDTSSPIRMSVKYTTDIASASGNAVLTFSFLPVETIGVLEADPTGGIFPLPRPETETETITAKAAFSSGHTINPNNADKLHKVESGDFSISNYYPGDVVFIQLVFTDDGTDNINLTIVSVEIDGVFWTGGDNL